MKFQWKSLGKGRGSNAPPSAPLNAPRGLRRGSEFERLMARHFGNDVSWEEYRKSRQAASNAAAKSPSAIRRWWRR
jgi:hypothetical protein